MELNKDRKIYDFMAIRKYWIAFSLILSVVSAILIWKPGPRYGIDFLGGTELTVQFDGPVETSRIRASLERMGHERPEVVPTTSRPNEFIIRVERASSLSPALANRIQSRLSELLARDAANGTLGFFRVSPGGDHIVVQLASSTIDGRAVAALAREAGANVRGNEALQAGAVTDHRWQVPLVGVGDQIFDQLRRSVADGGVGVEGHLNASVWVSPKAGRELRDAAVRAVLYSIVFIMIFVAFRFDLRFAPGGILALTHDSLVTLAFFVVTRKEVTISTVAAILTVVGYSMNDTIIVYDRIRENLAKRRNTKMLEVINVSVSEMLSRTLLSSTTVVLSVSAFAFIGTGVIRDFAWAMIVGVVAGTYSSIYVAAPFTEWIDSKFFHTAPVDGPSGDITVEPTDENATSEGA